MAKAQPRFPLPPPSPSPAFPPSPAFRPLFYLSVHFSTPTTPTPSNRQLRRERGLNKLRIDSCFCRSNFCQLPRCCARIPFQRDWLAIGGLHSKWKMAESLYRYKRAKTSRKPYLYFVYFKLGLREFRYWIEIVTSFREVFHDIISRAVRMRLDWVRDWTKIATNIILNCILL